MTEESDRTVQDATRLSDGALLEEKSRNSRQALTLLTAYCTTVLTSRDWAVLWQYRPLACLVKGTTSDIITSGRARHTTGDSITSGRARHTTGDSITSGRARQTTSDSIIWRRIESICMLVN